MKNVTPAPHPLFAPDSLYSRMRAGIRLEDKMRGYFHWLLARAERAGAAQTAQEPSREERLPSAGPGADVLAVQRARTFVYRTADPDRQPPGAAGHSARLLLVREADGSRTVGLVPEFDWKALRGPLPPRHNAPLPFRAFLFEPEVMKRLALSLKGEDAGCTPEVLLAAAFRPETVGSHFEVARILSAVPEWEGQLVDGGRAEVRRLPVPETCDRFPPRSEPLHVALVIPE